jgi:hypothetical protein
MLLYSFCYICFVCSVSLCCSVYCVCVNVYCTALYFTVWYCAVLYCTVLYCTVLYCTVLYCTLLYCTVLYCTVLYCTVLYYFHRVSTQLQLKNISYQHSIICIADSKNISVHLTVYNLTLSGPTLQISVSKHTRN